MPERFQLRRIPVCPTEEGELDEESQWIYKMAFVTSPISTQEYFNQCDKIGPYGGSHQKKGPETVEKIRDALNFMRNQQFEVNYACCCSYYLVGVSNSIDTAAYLTLFCLCFVPFQVPFIAFYRKEYVEPELHINDLWKVYQWDEKVGSPSRLPGYSVFVFIDILKSRAIEIPLKE